MGQKEKAINHFIILDNSHSLHRQPTLTRHTLSHSDTYHTYNISKKKKEKKPLFFILSLPNKFKRYTKKIQDVISPPKLPSYPSILRRSSTTFRWGPFPPPPSPPAPLSPTPPMLLFYFFNDQIITHIVTYTTVHRSILCSVFLPTLSVYSIHTHYTHTLTLYI